METLFAGMRGLKEDMDSQFHSLEAKIDSSIEKSEKRMMATVETIIKTAIEESENRMTAFITAKLPEMAKKPFYEEVDRRIERHAQNCKT